MKNVLLFKAWQNPFYQELLLKLDRTSTKAVSVENYEIKLFKYDYIHIPMYFCRVSFLATLDIYKDYFKGVIKWCKNNTCKKCLSPSFSLKKLLRLYKKGFVTIEHPDLHCWWSEELCSQHLLQVGELVTYWDPCIID